MSSVCIVDTSIFLNLLNVPNRNQQVEQVKSDYQTFAEADAVFILPMATILETGNHIAQNGDGNTRRETAQRFCEIVMASIQGEAPFRPSDFPNNTEVLSWLSEFVDFSGRNKSETQTAEGTSFGDLTIIKEYESCCKKFAMSEVFIWSLDADLSAYHRKK